MGKHFKPATPQRNGRVISDERRNNAIALETFVKKGKRYDASKAKDEKYYKKAKLLRSFHRMLKTEGIADTHKPEVEPSAEEALFTAQSSQDSHTEIAKQTSKESQTVCKFFISDKGCKNGMQCAYKHDMEQNSSKGKHRLRVCRFFQSRSGCSNGQRCKYLHQADDARALKQIDQVGIDPVKPTATKSTMMATWEAKMKKKKEQQEEKEAMIQERKERLEANRVKREEQTRRHRLRTRRGQPLMKNAIADLLSKIESS